MSKQYTDLLDPQHLDTPRPALQVVPVLVEPLPKAGESNESTTLSREDSILFRAAVESVLEDTDRSYPSLRQLLPRALAREVDRSTIYEATVACAADLGRIPHQLYKLDSTYMRRVLDAPPPRRYLLCKRAADIAVSLGLGVAFIPLLPIVAVAIKIDSPGPVIYSQTRVGLHGKPFRIYKFRTMRNDAEVAGAAFARKGDARITRLGRFMRKTRLDEVPQLFNVLKGEMSLIGPRPERPEYVQQLEMLIPGFELRTVVKPGLTGWAQIRYSYAGTIEELTRKLEYDFFYIAHASPRLDLRILLGTVRSVLSFKGQ